MIYAYRSFIFLLFEKFLLSKLFFFRWFETDHTCITWAYGIKSSNEHGSVQSGTFPTICTFIFIESLILFKFLYFQFSKH